MAEKLYYTMGEVAEMFDVNPSLIRYWEAQFKVLKPKRNAKGNRLFTPQDVARLKLIYHLVKERGMTLEGARKALRQQKKDGSVSREAELMERLQRIRSLLVAVREELKMNDDEVYTSSEIEAVELTPSVEAYPEPQPEPQPAPEVVEQPAEPAEEVAIEPVVEPAEVVAEETTEPENPEPTVEQPVAEPSAEPIAPSADLEITAPTKRSRKPRRKKDDDNQELFAFYEQSLF